ncbi:MAG: adenylate kinase [Acidobacteria bacterium]|nr:adenylate kinase [Acidobacteriota bacterium]
MGDSLRIVLLGAPGCGKGTQAARLEVSLGVPAISTGDMLRAAVAAGSELGQRVEGVMASGALVDDDLMADVVRDRLAQDDAAGGFLLDGYPRTAPQAGTLEEILNGRKLDHVVTIDVPDEVLVQRIVLRGRGADDQEEVVRERLQVYAAQTEPLIAHYDRLGLLRRVNGNVGIEQVTAAIESALAEGRAA